MSSTKKSKPLTKNDKAVVLKYAERVHATAERMLTELVNDTSDVPGPERYMVVSRVLLGMFSHHFALSIGTATRKMVEHEAAVGPTPPPSETL